MALKLLDGLDVLLGHLKAAGFFNCFSVVGKFGTVSRAVFEVIEIICLMFEFALLFGYHVDF